MLADQEVVRGRKSRDDRYRKSLNCDNEVNEIHMYYIEPTAKDEPRISNIYK